MLRESAPVLCRQSSWEGGDAGAWGMGGETKFTCGHRWESGIDGIFVHSQGCSHSRVKSVDVMRADITTLVDMTTFRASW